MEDTLSTPWHRASFDRFLNELLPALLAERLPLAGYRVAQAGATSCHVTVVVVADGEDVQVVYEELPCPDDDGIFWLVGDPRVVAPLASEQDLSQAAILCVGEQLLAFVEERLGAASPGMPWTEELLRAWLPLDTWLSEFLAGSNDRFAPVQPLQDTNWLTRHTHLRRMLLLERDDITHPSHLGRVCPFENPEGSNLGHILTIARGAQIRDGKLVLTERDTPASELGLSASMIPFLEHDDPNLVLMGANMLRQWVVQSQPEPALVRTGLEPASPRVWNGRNLLTALVSWGEGTVEDGILVSESCARRFDTPYPLRVGDKLANRHGVKGVVARILPDAAMPHLPDGTAVELVVSFANLHRRVSFGFVREALMGRIAQSDGDAATILPFQAPDVAELQTRLAAAGLPETGQMTLLQGKDGLPLTQPSTVGPVYWGRLVHLAEDKLYTFVGARWGQLQGAMECEALLRVGAVENLREAINTASIRREDNDILPERLAAGPVEPADAPTPLFRDLARRLRIAGVVADLQGHHLTFDFAPTEGETLKLSQPVPHPWLPERLLTGIGALDGLVPVPQPNQPAGDEHHLKLAYDRVVELNRRLATLLRGQAPARLREEVYGQLSEAVQVLFDLLLQPVHLRFRDRQDFTGRGVIVPGDGLALNQVGLPEEMAWSLFGPLVAGELRRAWDSADGDSVAQAWEAVARRDERAKRVLDVVMARSWVLINRAPTWSPAAIIAFHPVCVAGDAIAIPSLVCPWLNADFDGDQVAVILPLSAAAQREAGERLSVGGHLRRDPELLAALLPRRDALYGLAILSSRPGGLDEVSRIVGAAVDAPRGYVTSADLAKALAGVLETEGADRVPSRLTDLAAQGFEVAADTGASLAPFPDVSALVPPRPLVDTLAAWDLYAEAVAEVLAAPTDCTPASLAPQCLLTRTEGEGLTPLAWLVAGRGMVRDAANETTIVTHSYAEGLDVDEMLAASADARRGLAQVLTDWARMGAELREQTTPWGFSVLARARRATYPGIVFARAAAIGEVDPLTDVESRLFVGLDPNS